MTFPLGKPLASRITQRALFECGNRVVTVRGRLAKPSRQALLAGCREGRVLFTKDKNMSNLGFVESGFGLRRPLPCAWGRVRQPVGLHDPVVLQNPPVSDCCRL